MKFITAKHKYNAGRVQNPARGRSLGNYTYLYKDSEDRYEVRRQWSSYDKNPNYTPGVKGSFEYVVNKFDIPVFSIEKIDDNKTRIEILLNEEDHTQTLANVFYKHIYGMTTFICNHEMRFWYYNSNLGRGRHAPVLRKGLTFTVDDRNYITLDEGQKITSDKRFVNREKAKPINVRLKQLNKLGTVLTKLEAVTKADVNGAIDNRSSASKTVLDKLFGDAEFVADDVYRVLATTLGYWERNVSAPDPIKNQHQRFKSAMETLRKEAYKRAGVLEAKEIPHGNTAN